MKNSSIITLKAREEFVGGAVDAITIGSYGEHDLDAISAHISRDIICNPKKWQRKEQEESLNLTFGTAVHFAVLECCENGIFNREKFYSAYAIAPEVNKRTTAGKEVLKAFTTANAGKTILERKDFELILAMLESVLRTKSASAYLGCAEFVDDVQIFHEVKCSWKYRNIHGDVIHCRARMDTLVINKDASRVWIGDLKTTISAQSESFAKSVVQFGYGWQAGFYLLPFFELGICADFWAVAVEKTPYADIGVYNLKDFANIEIPNIRDFMDNSSEIIQRAKDLKEYRVDGDILRAPAWFNGTKIF